MHFDITNSNVTSSEAVLPITADNVFHSSMVNGSLGWW